MWVHRLLCGVAEVEDEQAVVRRFLDQQVLDPHRFAADPCAVFVDVSSSNKELADAAKVGLEKYL